MTNLSCFGLFYTTPIVKPHLFLHNVTGKESSPVPGLAGARSPRRSAGAAAQLTLAQGFPFAGAERGAPQGCSPRAPRPLPAERGALTESGFLFLLLASE